MDPEPSLSNEARSSVNQDSALSKTPNPPPKKSSKLQKRIQAGLSSNNSYNKSNTGTSTCTSTSFANTSQEDQVMVSSQSLISSEEPKTVLVEPSSLLTGTSINLLLSPSSFANALSLLPSPSSQLPYPHPKLNMRFPQPSKPDAFNSLSPDKIVMNSRKGTALGASH